VLNVLRMRERLPGKECESVNVRRDFCLGLLAGCGWRLEGELLFVGVGEGVVRACEVEVESSLYRMRNLVMFFLSSSMFRARISNLSVSAARTLPIAAEPAGVDGKRRCCAAADVEDVSIRSALGKCVVR
jgi:hypothetical protein